jgi:hypothetical protein
VVASSAAPDAAGALPVSAMQTAVTIRASTVSARNTKKTNDSSESDFGVSHCLGSVNASPRNARDITSDEGQTTHLHRATPLLKIARGFLPRPAGCPAAKRV